LYEQQTESVNEYNGFNKGKPRILVTTRSKCIYNKISRECRERMVNQLWQNHRQKEPWQRDTKISNHP